MANTYLSKTFSSSGTSDKKWTMSVWLKRGLTSAEHVIFGAGTSSREFIRFESNGQLTYRRVSSFQITTNRLFRDPNAWYHIVMAVDTTQGTASNRFKLYVNGVQETSFATASYMSQNYLPKIGGGQVHTIGKDSEQANPYFDGIMSHFHFCDGTQLAPTVFGSTDSTTGQWKINTSPSFTPGTNGFTVLKDGNTITDQSVNSNNFTLTGGTLTKTEDSPSNNWVTFNSISNQTSVTFANGNSTVSGASTSWKRAIAGLGNNSGKWYWEVKRASSGTPYIKTGMIEELGQTANMPSHEHHADNAYGWAWYVNGGTLELRTSQAVISGFSQSDLGNTTIANGDIICVALDLDNGRLHARKNNGSWFKSGNPTAGSGGYSIANFSANTKFYFPACSVYATTTAQHNFGNGFFGTTAVSSAGTNASGFGIFEFDVPAGFTALTTKGLNL